MEQIIIGVDTHKSEHVAVAITSQGAHVASTTIPATREGYRGLEAWAVALGSVEAFGIEGTGSYGAGLSRDLQARGHTVVDVMRPNRQQRHLHGKSDSLDAESAARSVLNGQARTLAKTQAGTSEMIRHIKVARDGAVKARSQAMITLRMLIINAPAALRASLEPIRGRVTLVRHLAALRPGNVTSPTASAKLALPPCARSRAAGWCCTKQSKFMNGSSTAWSAQAPRN